MKKIIPIILLLFMALPGFSQVQVLTQHNNNFRTGWNDEETLLNHSNVKSGSFGKLFSRYVDDQIYAQPLVARINIPGTGIRNVVFVATVNSSVYAFDADSSALGNPYWHVNLIPTGWRVMRNTDTACGNSYEDFSGNIGIVGTPVIDDSTGTLYVVVKSVMDTGGAKSFRQDLHALDIHTGQDKQGSPVTIQAQVNGSGAGSSGGVIHFDPQLENQRSGLLLSKGIIYIAWASHGDCGNYHGWIIGYDKSTLQQKYVYNSTPDGYQGGIWMSAGGLSADSAGFIYASVGNGAVGNNGVPSDSVNRSESALKLAPEGSSLVLKDFFTPSDYQILENGDEDFGVTGMLLIPGENQAFSGAKDGNIYLMNLDSLGGYHVTYDNVVQTFSQNSSSAHNIASLAFYGGSSHKFAYIWSDNVPLVAIPYDSTARKFNLANIITNSVQGPVGYNGAFLSVSSNHQVDSTAILWVSHAADNCNANQQTCPGILRAIDANDVTHELWNSSDNSWDNPGNYAKFNCPTIANGKVYLASFSDELDVYGLTYGKVTGLDKDENFGIRVYPNPTGNRILITSGDRPIDRILIFNLDGINVMDSKSDGKKHVELSLNNISAGFYILEVVSGNEQFRQKILIRR